MFMAIPSYAYLKLKIPVTETRQSPTLVTQEHGSMYFNGSFTLNGVERGIVLISPKADQLLYLI
jgi:hypothetical protein